MRELSEIVKDLGLLALSKNIRFLKVRNGLHFLLMYNRSINLPKNNVFLVPEELARRSCYNGISMKVTRFILTC